VRGLPFPGLVASALAAIPALAAASGGPASGWSRARTPHFDLLCEGVPADAVAAATALSRFRRVLQGLLPRRGSDAEAPVVVLAFRSEGSFRSFVPRIGAEPRAVDGFFQGGTARRYIAFDLGASRTDRYDALYHEYAHLALNESLPAQPAWVAEGLAELFAAWRPEGTAALVGLPRTDHVAALRRRGLLPLDQVLRADYSSELYVREGRCDLFYAQSWLLAHYVVLGRPGGKEQLERYLSSVAQGQDSASAFARALGEELPALSRRLRAYLDAPARPVATLGPPGLAEEASAEPPASTVPALAEVEYAMGDLLVHQDRAREARGHFARAVAEDPGFVPARDGLAQVALGQARWDEARAQLKAELEREPESPLALHRYADVLVKEAARRGQVLSDDDTDAAVAALEKAVSRAPHFIDAAELLARLRPQPARRRIALLEPAFAREPQRTDVAITLAGLYTRVDDLGRAAAVLARARTAARDDDMRFLAGHLLGRLGFAAALTAEAQGTLVALECRADGALDFIVQIPDGRLRLRAAGPRAVLLYGAEGEPLERDLVCGPQSAPVTVVYRRQEPLAPRGREADALDERPAGVLLSIAWPAYPTGTSLAPE